MSTGGIFNVATGALLANRAAMQIVGQNVANAQTPGYVRARPVLIVVPGAVVSSRGEAGLGGGVAMTGVQRLRDELLLCQMERQTGRAGCFEGRGDALAQVEALFTDLQGFGVSQALGEFFGAFTRLSANPASSVLRSEVLQRAGVLTDALSRQATELDVMRERLDDQLGRQVTEVNRLVNELAEVNRQIGAAQGGARADLESLQDPLMAGLARLVGAQAIRHGDGTMDVVIGGQRLLQGSGAQRLRVEPDPANPGLSRVVFDSDGAVAPVGGRMAGALAARDDLVPAYLQRLNVLARTLADAVNAQHRRGFDLQGNAGGDFFTYGANAARSLAVSVALRGHPEALAASAGGAPGEGNNALAIANIQDAKLLDGGISTCEQFYAGLICQVGSDTAAARDLSDSATAIAQSLEQQYQSQVGVSLDEEGVELLRYQQAYQAAARVVQAALRMMDTALEIR